MERSNELRAVFEKNVQKTRLRKAKLELIESFKLLMSDVLPDSSHFYFFSMHRYALYITYTWSIPVQIISDET